ncbi:hypothetical protein [Legionella sp. CNM-4043-24]|uniref:hypothetical protein n=1 Tax=Legionella sp. CNM-4043-24 TaxID=3421646 RepID=UPI00403AB1EB
MMHGVLLMGLSVQAMAGSVVTLAGGGNVLPATSLQLSLTGLLPSVTYSVVCYIDTTYPFQYVQFGSNFSAPTSVLISSSLNGRYVSQDQLIPGHNIAVIDGQFTNPSTDKLVFSNLDQTNSFNVNNCFAISKRAFL